MRRERMRQLMTTLIVATALLFIGGSGWKADASTFSSAANIAAAVQSNGQVQTIGCRRPGYCPWGRFWNGRRCVRCW